MQSMHHLKDEVANYISERKQNPGQFYCSKIDLKYAYSQIQLDPNIQKHCNFSLLGGKATGTYRFINGFYGLTDMPATFQKTIDKTLVGIHSKFAFLDDILIITKGSLNDHEHEIDKVLNLLDKENLAIKLQKCEFAKTNIVWLGFKIHPNGIIPTNKKRESIVNLDTPKKLKQLRSFMGCIHHLIKFTPNLATLSDPPHHLMGKIGMKISELKTQDGKLYFSKIDLKYAYSQIPLRPDTQKHCNFNILRGNATGTYKFLNGFYD